MTSLELLRSEANLYVQLADQLKAEFAGIDEETLKDTLEGLSGLPEMIEEVVRSSLEDENFVVGLKARMGEMQVRLARLEARQKKKRDLACWAMGTAGLNTLQAGDFSVSLRAGQPRLEIEEEAKLPATYFVPQPPKLDRAGLLLALKRGEVLDGAKLATGSPHIQVRTK
ncbi:MAG: siphovirus Gp157 family protein [Alphaproteobacteria bacterium]|nr:siphovirus Gp157 family protein [Alphaproteobacteria bacterium]MDE2496040.1 siphovirus Gp157 family protein [Alphaproteobacteria bacterium]